MARNDPWLLLPALFLFVACGSAVPVEASDASTGMSSTSTGGESESSGSETTSTSTSTSTSTAPPGSTSTDETGSAQSSSTGDTPSEPAVCVHQCEVDEDCWLSGSFFGLTCSDAGRCIAACEESAECTPIVSGWLAQPCLANDECPGGTCVDFGQPDGTGGCAMSSVDASTCGNFGFEETDVVDIDGAPAVVCALQAECTDVEDQGSVCTPVGVSPINCERDGCPQGLLCRADGACGCEDDDGCRLAEFGDTCFDGFCISDCSGTNECDDTSPYNGGEVVCTPIG